MADGYTNTAGSWRVAARDPLGAAGIDVTNRLLARYVVVLQLAEDQSGYVASILSRRARLLGLMWDLDNSPLVNKHYHRARGRS
jgi:hypothetical protein